VAVTLLREDGAVVCARCEVADTFLTRGRGLLGKRALAAGEGVLIKPCSSIHMFFMRFPIDAVFLDRDLRVLKVVSDLKPWRMAAKRGAKAVLEFGAGEAAKVGLEPGVRLVLAEEESGEPAER
jgi:uncharacterized membrane protein (UPF0127 family)